MQIISKTTKDNETAESTAEVAGNASVAQGAQDTLPPSLFSVPWSLFRVLWRCARVNNCSDVELKNQLSLKTDAQAALFVEATHVGWNWGSRQRGNKGNSSALFGRSPEELDIMP